MNTCFNVPEQLGKQEMLVSRPGYLPSTAKSIGMFCSGAAVAEESFIEAGSANFTSYDGPGARREMEAIKETLMDFVEDERD